MGMKLLLLLMLLLHGKRYAKSSELTEDELEELLSLLDEHPQLIEPDHPLIALGDLLLDEEEAKNEQLEGSSTSGPYPMLRVQGAKKQPVAGAHNKGPVYPHSKPTPQSLPPPTSTIPTMKPKSAQRRQDEVTKDDLVDQLALFNSLLSSLSSTELSTMGTSETTPAPTTSTSSGQMSSDQLLSAIFGPTNLTSTSTLGPTTTTTEKVQGNTSVSKREGDLIPSASEQSSILSTTVNQTLTDKKPLHQGEQVNPTDLASSIHALNELLKTTQSLNSANSNPLGNFQNSNHNMQTAATNQLTNMLALLGTLGSLTNPSGNLLGGAQQPNFLQSILTPQLGQASGAGGIFAPQSQQTAGSLNFGNVLSPGIGGLMSVVRSMLGGIGGQPRVRGNGVDTRVGLGYRLGDSADAQLVFDIGPQIFTQKIQQEHRPSALRRRDQIAKRPFAYSKIGQSSDQVISRRRLSLQDKAEQEKRAQLAAVKRRMGSLTSGKFARRSSLGHSSEFPFGSPGIQKKNSNRVNPELQEAMLKELWKIAHLEKSSESATISPLSFRHKRSTIDVNAVVEEKLNAAPTESLAAIGSLPSKVRIPAPSNQRLLDNLRNPMDKTKLRRKPLVRDRRREGNPNRLSSNRMTNRRLKDRRPLMPMHKFKSFHKPGFGARIPGTNTRYRTGLGGSDMSHRFRRPPAPVLVSRRDWDHHALAMQNFENFKNTNKELIMTDTTNDRFFVKKDKPGRMPMEVGN